MYGQHHLVTLGDTQHLLGNYAPGNCLAKVLYAVMNYKRPRITENHEARSGSGIEEVIDRFRCHR
jgi:hypothetical protein